jgi:hypothetical protein
MHLEANGRSLQGADPDRDVPLVERVAAGKASQAEIIDWLGTRTRTTPDV